MGYNAEMTKTIENYDDRPEGLLPFKEEDTLKISHVMILADPIDRNEDELWFKFSIPYGEGGTGFDYEVEAFCLNFTYSNFVKAKEVCLSIYDINLMGATVFEWTNSSGEDKVSLLANDPKLIPAMDLMIHPSKFLNGDEVGYVGKAEYWPPVKKGFRL